MESRKIFYKSTKPLPSLSDRIKKDRARQNITRKDKFNANRKIDIDLNDSTSSTPAKLIRKRLSQTRDKKTRLQSYIEQKRTAKLKEKIEEREPFIPYVPVGRWLEKPEPTHKPKKFIISTPIKKALMSDGKILKKSTIKQIALATTTSKKENAGIIKKDIKNQEFKSKRKILLENNFNETNLMRHQESKEKPLVEDKSIIEENKLNERTQSLNETFELITDDSVIELFDDKKEDKSKTIKPNEPQKSTQDVIKLTGGKEKVKVFEGRETRAKIIVPVKPIPKKLQKSENEMQSRQKVVPQKSEDKLKKTKNKQGSDKSKKQQKNIKSPENEQKIEKMPTPISPPKTFSQIYKFYTSCLQNQVAYIEIQLKDIKEDINGFIANLSEDTQTIVHQTIQQADILVNDKFKVFKNVLEKFEMAQIDHDQPKRITEDDLENYWLLLYDQIEKLKENLNFIHETKKKENKKRRTTRLHSLVDSTPSRRSRRIAEKVDTPLHSAMCYGCTPLSSSRINTPKSAKSTQKRRATFKKSIAFDEA